MKNSILSGLLLLSLLSGTGRSLLTEKRMPNGENTSRASAVPALSTTDSLSPKNGTTPRKGPFMRNDTLFFYDFSHRDATNGFTDYCRVFVDKNPLSGNYSRMDRLASPDSEQNRQDLAALAAALRNKYPGQMRRHDLKGCPATWLQLVSLDGEYYLDELNMYPITITDSLFVEQTQDGPWPSLLDAFERPGAGHYRFQTRGLRGERRSFDLLVTDTLRKVAVLVEHDGETTRYQLLAAKETPPQFDLLVWESAELPTSNEIRRDTIDFGKLIAGCR